MKIQKNKIVLLGIVAMLGGVFFPQLAEAGSYVRTYSFTRTTTSPVVVLESPALTERVIERPAVIERFIEHPVIIEKTVEHPVMVERIVEKPVIVEKTIEKPAIVEKRVEMPVIIDRSRDDHLINLNVLRLLDFGLF